MINNDKWIESLPKVNSKLNEDTTKADHYRWINTIPKQDTYSDVKKYSSMIILFICGLLFVSAVKNQTRSLEKEIDSLKASNKLIKFNLDQAILDNEVITSPENISRLAKEYLNSNFIPYKKTQIMKLNKDEKIIRESKENINLSESLKLGIAKKIEKKRTEIRKLQELYQKPESIPGEIKTQVAKKIEEKKGELKNLYENPNETITIQKAQKWAAVQVVKVFLGLPIIPGK